MSLLGVPNFGVEVAKYLERDQHRRTAVSEWQKIETAPKDGTDVIGCYWCDWGDGTTSYYGPWTMAWRGGEWVPSWDGATVIAHQSDFGTDYETLDSNPSHWMPLPPPPEVK